jgi:dUTP pyrophosphatase
MHIKIKKLHKNAVIPTYAKQGDAGLDLVVTDVIGESPKDITYGFGLALEIPEGYVGLVFPRSSIRKTDLALSNAVGVIDSGYRGEIQATFKKIEDWPRLYRVGERAAQIMIMPIPYVTFEQVSELSATERGVGAFGSSGN